MKTDKEKELDKLFKEGLDDPFRNTNFREDDWDAMETMLNESKKPAGILVYWVPIVSSIAAMLLLTLAWALMKGNDDPAIVNQPAKPAIHTKKGITGGSPASQQVLASVRPIAKDTISNQAGVIASNNSIAKNADKVSFDDKKAIAAVNRNKNNGSGNKNPVKALLNGSARKQYIAGQNTKTPAEAVLNTPGYVPGAGGGGAFAALDVPVITSPITADALLLKQSKPQILAVYQPDTKTIKKLNPNRPQYAITVMASPDINGVNTFQNSMVGANIGLLFSATLGKKFTVSTGALYSKKPYLTNFSDYKGTYSFKYAPDNVTADCRVLDIPINVDYQLYNRAKNKFSIGTGLSSYLMLNENYHYNYNNPVTVTYGSVTTVYSPPDYNVSNKNQHYLGVLNLQASYARKLNSKFSVGVEPYLKIPLTNIGAGQVKLQSTGVAVGVTWNINSPPK